jgi:bifunctional N-acetylglucosamine-1-phosphate-uridyltransferase/glucosamine-1-phosphate-acetyltransferase GlmU-like protein
MIYELNKNKWRAVKNYVPMTIIENNKVFFTSKTFTTKKAIKIYENKIGKNTTIEYGALLKNSVIGSNCLICGKSTITNSKVANNTIIGEFCTLVNTKVRTNSILIGNVHAVGSRIVIFLDHSEFSNFIAPPGESIMEVRFVDHYVSAI